MNTKKIVTIALFAALICVISPLAIPIGAVPITLSVFIIMLTALLLKPADAVIAVIIYLALGAVGLPVFSGFRGSLAVLAGPTGGYLLAYPVMVLMVAPINKKPIVIKAVALVFALAFCYAAGSLQLAAVNKMNYASALLAGAVPFIPMDAAKLAIALFISKPLQKACAPLYKR